jgi:hypothetical protein
MPDKIENQGFRDAIHVPFVVTKCNELLQPGAKCSLRDEDYDNPRIACVRWSDGDRPDWHGIADPFRETPIAAGELFRLYIRKECFSGMTHQFQIEVHDRGGTDTCHSVCNIF